MCAAWGAEVVCQWETTQVALTVGQLGHLPFLTLSSSYLCTLQTATLGLPTELTASRCDLFLPVFQDNQKLLCSCMAINNHLEPGAYKYKESFKKH